MRTSAELLRATKPFARETRWRSWWHLWSTLGILASLLGLTVLAMPWPCRLLASLLAGLVMVRMFIIYHDHQHGTILRKSVLANVLLSAFGVLILSPRGIWKHAHNHHHRRNARVLEEGIGTFPVMTTQAFAQASRRQRFVYALTRHPLTILGGYVTIFLYGMCLYPVLLRPRQHADSGLALLLHAGAVTALAVFAPDVLLWTLLLPLIVASALGSYLFYAQHNFPGVHFPEKGSWDYVSAALRASSYIPMNPVLRWFTGNIGYHHVHHLNARIPFYRLPEAMAQLQKLQSPGVASLSPLGVYRCLRLKLWDPEQQRMVNFAGW